MEMLESDLFRVFPALILAIGVWYHLTQFQLIRRLKAAHRPLWRRLGEPTVRGALLTGGRAWSIWSTDRSSYVAWLWNHGYRQVNDPRAKTLGTLLTIQTWVAIGLVALWLIVAWHNGNARPL